MSRKRSLPLVVTALPPNDIEHPTSTALDEIKASVERRNAKQAKINERLMRIEPVLPAAPKKILTAAERRARKLSSRSSRRKR